MRMRYILLFLSAAITPASAQVDGFVIDDLTAIEASMKSALGSGFDSKAEPRRLTFACPRCAGAPLLDVLLSRQSDGTEQRVRSGETKIADLERLCQQRSPQCHLSALNVTPAIGWISSYPTGGTAGATVIIIRQEKMLTVRSLAKDAATARQNIDRLIPVIRAQLIGK